MKLFKKIIIVSGLLFCIIGLLLILNLFNQNVEIKTSGLITIRNYSYDKKDGSSFKSGIRIIDASDFSNKGIEVLNDGCDYLHPSLTSDKKKIIAYSWDSKDASGQIIEYDIDSKIKKVLYTFDSEDYFPDYIRIIPNSNQISFGFRGGVYIINNENKPIKIDDNQRFTDVFWMPDGKQFLYGYGYEVFKYDINSKKKEKFMDGSEVQISKSGNYITHIEESGNKDLLIVKDLKNDKEYKYKNIAIQDYCLSPDESCVAIIDSSLFGFYSKRVHIWDFKNDKEKTIISSIPEDAGNTVDWK